MRLSIPRCATSGTTGCRSRRWCCVAVGLTTAVGRCASRTGFCPDMPWAVSGRARRHRRAARRRGGNGDPAPGQAALPPPQDPRRRKPAQRRQRAPDLPRRGRRRLPSEHIKVQRVSRPPIALALFGSLHGRLSCSRGLWTPMTQPHHGGAERDHHAIRRHLHGVDRRRAYRAVRHSHHRRLCDHDRPHRARADTPARLRVASYAVWETVVFVLNVLAFMLIGHAAAIRSGHGLDDRGAVQVLQLSPPPILAVVILDPHRLGDAIRRLAARR